MKVVTMTIEESENNLMNVSVGDLPINGSTPGENELSRKIKDITKYLLAINAFGKVVKYKDV